MRTKDTLMKGFEDLKILNQYLYMNEDHYIIFNNGLTDLKIRMDENLNCLCINLSFPDLEETLFEQGLNYWLAVIERLEDKPAIEFPNSFKNRWEEIKTITQTNLALNR